MFSGRKEIDWAANAVLSLIGEDSFSINICWLSFKLFDLCTQLPLSRVIASSAHFARSESIAAWSVVVRGRKRKISMSSSR